MWFGINEWLNLANLTPVFGINDNETDKGVWDPKSTLPLLEMSDKFGVTCYWQLGYDCSNKTAVQYVEDLNILRQTLGGFPEHNGAWKIVGSDLSRCKFDQSDQLNFKNYVNDLDENVDAVMWESDHIPRTELGVTKSALWTSVPKDSKPVTFSSAMEWAKRIGEGAKMEYDVIFRQPRLLEMTHDTPVYWFSFLHKKLMGANVLDVQPANPNPELSAFAHCTKRQNNFVRTGAVTVMLINNGSDSITSNVRLGNFMLEKSMEVQSYLLTALDGSKTKVYLNGKKLTMEMLKHADDILKPKLRRAKLRGYISLEIPPQSIGFFVLAGAKNALCSNNEEDLSAILAEINEDQDVSASDEVEFEIEGRWHNANKGDSKNAVRTKTTLETIKKNILKEMEVDNSYYNKMLKKQRLDGDNLNSNSEQENVKDATDIDEKKEVLHKHLRAFIRKAKKSDLSKNAGGKRQKEKLTLPPSNLHFTIKEIEDILKNRAKARAAAKNMKLTSSELDMLVDKATIKLPKHFVSKRDINALLLEEKANFHKNNMFSQETYEQRAKQHKLFPKFKFRRSEPSHHKIKRNINRKLLNMKAKLEEHKKYMLKNNSPLRSSHSSHKHQNIIPRLKRDINLDLLKKHAGPNMSHGKIVAVQPNLGSYKNHLFEDEIYAPRMIEETSDEHFPDFLESEEGDTNKLFRDMANSDLYLSNLARYFKVPKSKYIPHSYSPPSMQKWDLASIRTSKRKNKSNFDSDDNLEFSRSSNELVDFDDDFLPCSHDWGFSDESQKKVKSNRVMDLWPLKTSKIGRNKKDKSSVTDLDELFSTDNFEYGYLRKKREANSVTQEKLKTPTKGIKTDIKKLRKQTTENKVNYIKEKLKNKKELRKHKQIEKMKEKGLESSQIVPKNRQQGEGSHHKSKISKVNNLNANDMISPSIDNKVKRSLLSNDLNSLFGQYQPLTAGLRPWKPVDILGLQNSLNLNTLPLYTWMQNQNLRNMLLQNGIYGRRKRRYIEDGSVMNSIENEIFSIEEQKKGNYKMDKTEYPKGDVLKENELLMHDNSNNNVEARITLSIKNTTPLAIKNGTSQTYDSPVVDKMASGEKMSSLERILGKKKVKPLEDFYDTLKKSFNKMNENIKDFFKNIF